MSDALEQALESAFAEATRRYQEKGFQRRVGFGKRPALISVDLANAWTRPGHPFSCEHMDDRIIPSMQALLKGFRKYKFPVVHVTTCYEITDRDDPNTDMTQWHNKIPVDYVDQAKPELWSIDSRIAPVDGELTMIKKHASSFAGTSLHNYLTAAGVDTILVTGVTACACVRQTVCDGLAAGFRPIAVKEAIGDRVPGAVQWNLFDIDAKFGDVETTQTCLDYLDRIGQEQQVATA